MGKELRQLWIEIALDITFVDKEIFFRTCKITYRDSEVKLSGRYLSSFLGLPMQKVFTMALIYNIPS